ncbi:type VI secretion system tip protein TssI/VgrG, partial [Consotaella aegiceratis]|uniref:type VI secretion system tip protein TssI/VgrG n=1 Tax=Consotaella aegiceratis TaxID=3097961 RepID=UPI002F3EFAD6
SFEAVPSRVPLTPHRATKRPRIEGAQVGIVAGPEGEEIHCDQYGRVKLWFPWDRRAKKDGSDTTWCRVSQAWAGGTWGGQIIPRIGMEAMVSYIDGDPDRPLITGLVPNTRQKVPYELPANKTKSAFRTDSHKDREPGNFNEITFEDEKGIEEIFIQAQKDMHIGIKNNYIQYANGNHHTQVGRNETKSVLGWSDTYINQSYSISTGRNFYQLVGNPNAVLSVLSKEFVSRNNFHLPFDLLSLNTDLSKDHTQGSLITVVSGDISTDSAGHYTLNVSGNAHCSYENGFSAISGNEYTVSSNRDIHILANQAVAIGAATALVIKCGESEIIMKKSGEIDINGTSIKINGKESITHVSPKIDLN